MPSISDRQVLVNSLGLVAAGTDTTANSIAQMVYILASNPDQFNEVRREPNLRPQMIEEVLRLRVPIRGLLRTTTRATVLGGVDIPENAKVFIHIGSACRDEKAFSDPEALDIHRENLNRHLAMGALNRLCLGAPLAKLQMRKAIDALIERLPNLRLAQSQQELRYSQSMIVPSLKQLIVAWDLPQE